MADFRPVRWRIGDTVLTTADRTLIMGVLNVTPDSFSDGGLYLDREAAINHGVELSEQGADLIDVGGESTRPGATGVDIEEELRRTLPVVEALVEQGIVVSIDTSKPTVAETALDAGAVVVNDVRALADEGMARVVADSGAGVVLMHMLGSPRTMQDNPYYADVVQEVLGFLTSRARFAEEAGIGPDRICIDPGIGFGKTVEHNLRLLADLELLVATGYPVLVGTSRKTFLRRLLASEEIAPLDEGTGATVALAIARGAAMLRVHNVAIAARVARIADAIVRSKVPEGTAE